MSSLLRLASKLIVHDMFNEYFFFLSLRTERKTCRGYFSALFLHESLFQRHYIYLIVYLSLVEVSMRISVYIVSYYVSKNNIFLETNIYYVPSFSLTVFFFNLVNRIRVDILNFDEKVLYNLYSRIYKTSIQNFVRLINLPCTYKEYILEKPPALFDLLNVIIRVSQFFFSYFFLFIFIYIFLFFFIFRAAIIIEA